MFAASAAGLHANGGRRRWEASQRFGLFRRALVGLDREAANDAFAKILSGKTLNANQIEFVNEIITYLVDQNVLDVGLLYESPFTDLAPGGPVALFTDVQLREIAGVLEHVRESAIAT